MCDKNIVLTVLQCVIFYKNFCFYNILFLGVHVYYEFMSCGFFANAF